MCRNQNIQPCLPRNKYNRIRGEYTEYVFFAFAATAIIYILEKRTIMFAKEHYFLLGFCFISFLTSLWAIDFNTAFNSIIQFTSHTFSNYIISQ